MLPHRTVLRTAIAFAAIMTLTACGSGESPGGGDTDVEASASSAAGAGGLSATELEHGIGPVDDLELGTVDPALAEAGKVAYTTKCSACHKIEERYVGPRLGTVLARRSPEFVMNMVLNANEMVERHPVVREMLAQFYTPMPVQVTDPDEARAILEYLRTVQIDSTATAPSAAAGGDEG